MFIFFAYFISEISDEIEKNVSDPLLDLSGSCDSNLGEVSSFV
jgi:hypothetical protein